ncbi:MAG: hypothetical protein HUU18_00900 [Phycisphaerales bacterium]|nr:hypothetical protein [Phycisphaerales bacterium]
MVAVIPVMAGVFVLATGISKMLSPEAFNEAVRAHALIPGWMTSAAVWVVPVGEAVIGGWALWLIGVHQTVGRASLWLVVLFAVFAGYAGLLWLNPPASGSSCGCGWSEAPAAWASICARNLLMVGLLSGVLLVEQNSHRSVSWSVNAAGPP